MVSLPCEISWTTACAPLPLADPVWPTSLQAQLFNSAAEDALLPAAEVVGVVQRSGAEVVACITEEDEKALAAREVSTRQVGWPLMGMSQHWRRLENFGG